MVQECLASNDKGCQNVPIMRKRFGRRGKCKATGHQAPIAEPWVRATCLAKVAFGQLNLGKNLSGDPFSVPKGRKDKNARQRC